MCLKFIVSFIFIILLSQFADAQLSLNDPCHNEGKNVTGQCVLLKDCPSAIEDIDNKRNPQICGYHNLNPIVCCPIEVGDIAKKKCFEYGQTIYKLETPVVFKINPKKINISTCAIVKRTLIIGGENAKEKEFPHMALLGYGNLNKIKWKCGGSLISERFVLTAGHCVKLKNGLEVKYIRLGELNIKDTEDENSQDFNVSELILYPEYKFTVKYHDIALVKLSRTVVFSDYIRPACLDVNKVISAKRLIATGFGIKDLENLHTTFGTTPGTNHLQKVVLDKFTHEQCNYSYEDHINQRLQHGIDSKTQFCAGGETEQRDTCQGDSGGPIQIYHPNVTCMYSLIGITSFGKSCAIVGVPGVYTRISYYIEWIEKTVWS